MLLALTNRTTYAHTWQYTDRLSPYHKAPSKPVMLGEGQSPKREKGKAMKKGKTLRFIVVFLSGFLATTSSVYAFHFTAAGVKSDITPETAVQFWFLGVSSPKPESKPVIPTQFQCTVVHKGEDISFRLFASAQENASFKVEPSDPDNPDRRPHIITITGKLLSHIVFVSKLGVRFFTEINDFTASGVDVALPGEDHDTFDLKFEYSAKGIGPLLSEALESELVTCDADTCTLSLKGTVEFGEIEAHTSGGD